MYISVLSRSSFVVFIIEVFGPESLFVTTLIQREAIVLTPAAANIILRTTNTAEA